MSETHVASDLTYPLCLQLLVIASIHQPSTATFELFDSLLLLSQGRTTYNGPIANVQTHFASLGHEMPLYTNPAEYLLQLINTDFASNQATAKQELDSIIVAWEKSKKNKEIVWSFEDSSSVKPALEDQIESGPSKLLIPVTLTHRSIIKAYRDLIAYGIRVAMYIGLAVMMGTVWLRLGEDQENIRSFLNAIVSEYSVLAATANKTVLRRSFHVFYGSGVYSSLSGRSISLQKRARQLIVRAGCIYGVKLHHWSTFPL